MPSTHDRKFDGIQFETIRKRIDARFNAVHDALEDAYYGTPQFDGSGKFTERLQDGWKHGVGNAFKNGTKTYDKAATPALSKTQFDKLHGLIWDMYQIERVADNAKLPPPQRKSVDKLDPFKNDAQGVPTIKRYSDLAQDRIDALKLENLELVIP